MSCWRKRIPFQAEGRRARPLRVHVTQQLLVAGQEVILRASFSLSATSELLQRGRNPPRPPRPLPRMSFRPPPALLPSSSHPAAVPATLRVGPHVGGQSSTQRTGIKTPLNPDFSGSLAKYIRI